MILRKRVTSKRGQKVTYTQMSRWVMKYLFYIGLSLKSAVIK